MSTNDVSGVGGSGIGGGAVSAATTSSGAKITHVKPPTTSMGSSVVDVGGINVVGNVISSGATILTSGGSITTAAGTLKMTNAVGGGGGTSTSQQQLQQPTTTAAAIRALNAGGAAGQSTVRVVMPTGGIMPSSMIKQLENAAAASAAAAAASGRTQITAIPASVSRTVSNTSITVSRPLTQTTYLPRATASQMTTGAGGANAGIVSGLSSLTANMTATSVVGGGVVGQRLITPMRTMPTSVATAAGAGNTVTSGGLTAAGSFIRGTAVSRNVGTGVVASSCATPVGSGIGAAATTVISPASSTTWMAANTSGQVQLIRAIPHQSRQRIITTTQGLGGVGNVGSGGTVVAATSAAQAIAVAQQLGQQQHPLQQQTQNSGTLGAPTLQTVVSSAQQQQQQQQQQTYVATLATVLPPRQHQATLVYSSNVAAAASSSSQMPQQFNPSVVASGGQRFAVATPLNAASGTLSSGGTSVATPRQIRPIPLGKSFSKLNTTSISIRTPTIPQLTPTLGNAGTVVAGTANSPRSTNVSGGVGSGGSIGIGVGAAGNVIPTSNLSTTRIIQLQQPGGATQQIIGSAGRLAGNVMLQPIIVNTGKIGYRPPVTMAAKVQPSLTITQLGIGKLPATASVTSSAQQQQQQQQLIQSSGAGGGTPPTLTATNLSSATGLLTTQNLVSASGNSGIGGGGATMLPLAITTRGGPGGVGNILTGTITPIKNASGITVGKMMSQADATAAANVYIHQQQQQQQQRSATAVSVASSSGGSINTAVSSSSATAFLPPGSTIYYESMSAIGGGGVNSSSSTSAGVLSLTTSTATSSTLSSVAVQQQHQIGGAAVVSSANAAVSAANLAAAINSLPFATHAVSAAGSGATFTVVPSGGGGGRTTIGQLQLPAVSSAAAVSGSGTQIQAVPVRFSAQLNSSATVDAISSAVVAQMPPQLHTIAAGSGGIGNNGQQLLLTAPQHGSSASAGGGQQPHMVIPLQTSIKFTAACGIGNATTFVPNFLQRKRDADGSPIRAAKNLGPTLLSMGSATATSSASTGIGGGGGSPAASSVCSSTSFSVASVATVASNSSAANSSSAVGGASSSSALTAEALASHKERVAAVAGRSRAESPESSDGSTTVSANSSPGVEQQMQDAGNLLLSRLPTSAASGGANVVVGSGSASNDAMHFNPINDLYSNHHSVTMQHQHELTSTPISSRNSSLDHQQQLMHASSVVNAAGSSIQRLNGNANDVPPRKKSRRSTNDSQQSTQSQASLSAVLPPPHGAVISSNTNNSIGNSSSTDSPISNAAFSAGNGPGSHVTIVMPSHQHHQHHHHHEGVNHVVVASTNNINNNHHRINDNIPAPPTQTTSNKENAKPVEFVLRRPRLCTLMQTYKQNWKPANNHFQRYTDVKPREERRPTVIDLANQANVMGKINGWKIHHLRSQMEDLCENESSGYEKLSTMLKQMESHDNTTNPEIERISDLLKGNMQRSKIIVDGVNEAQNQMMKIFDHKTHISDIIQRCASKRNFKKRDKL